VTVVGLSAGGLVAAWAAQYRSELDKAVLIAPSTGFGSAGRYFQLFFMNAERAMKVWGMSARSSVTHVATRSGQRRV
jgi:alpha-beta hydrolase superfamily lysophospholipase